MKWNKILFKVFVISLILFTMPIVLAYSYNDKSLTASESTLTLDTKYEAACYYPKEKETYNIDLVWEDLHLTFLYGDDIKKISNSFIKNDSKLLNNTNLNKNDSLLDSVTSFILVKNKSGFPINVSGKIKSDKYIYGNNRVKLEIANCNSVCNKEDLSFKKEVNATKLLNKNEIKLIVKPIVENTKEYNVEDVIVTENVKLFFSKN